MRLFAQESRISPQLKVGQTQMHHDYVLETCSRSRKRRRDFSRRLYVYATGGAQGDVQSLRRMYGKRTENSASICKVMKSRWVNGRGLHHRQMWNHFTSHWNHLFVGYLSACAPLFMRKLDSLPSRPHGGVCQWAEMRLRMFNAICYGSLNYSWLHVMKYGHKEALDLLCDL
jgi:hypothetical protein